MIISVRHILGTLANFAYPMPMRCKKSQSTTLRIILAIVFLWSSIPATAYTHACHMESDIPVQHEMQGHSMHHDMHDGSMPSDGMANMDQCQCADDCDQCQGDCQDCHSLVQLSVNFELGSTFLSHDFLSISQGSLNTRFIPPPVPPPLT